MGRGGEESGGGRSGEEGGVGRSGEEDSQTRAVLVCAELRRKIRKTVLFPKAETEIISVSALGSAEYTTPSHQLISRFRYYSYEDTDVFKNQRLLRKQDQHPLYNSQPPPQ